MKQECIRVEERTERTEGQSFNLYKSAGLISAAYGNWCDILQCE
jgi:hypothetical protein